MKKEFCTYEQSLALKELGFNETCFSMYNKDDNGELYESEGFYYNYNGYKAEAVLGITLAPLIQQAFRFFREKYCLYQVIHIKYDGIWSCFIYKNKDGKCALDGFKTYEEAEQACLDKLIELAKESK